MDELDPADVGIEEGDARGRVTCGMCGGTGRINLTDCHVCQGEGFE